jgi:DNA-binding protein HU-beta
MANKQDLVARTSDKVGFTKKDAGTIVEGFVDEIIKALNNGEKVSIPGLGIFEVVETKERTAFINPRQRDLGRKAVPASKKVSFKRSSTLAESVK